MAERTIEYLKSKFQNGDKPNEQDFIDLIDTLNKINSKIFIEKPIDSSINNDAINRLCRLNDDGKIEVWQPLPSTPGTGGEWSITVNHLTDKNEPSIAGVVLNQFLDTPEVDDTFTLSYTNTDGGSIVNAVFTFKSTASTNMEITIDADPLGMLININDKINTYITDNSLSGRITSSVTFDGYIVINSVDYSSEPNGKWSITYKPSSDPIYDTNEFEGGSSGVNSIINLNGNILSSSSWNDIAITVNEEATALKDYINENYNEIVIATVDENVVTINVSDTSLLEFNISLGDIYPSECLLLSEIEPYISATPPFNGYTVLGIINSIDLANQKAIVQTGGQGYVRLSENSMVPEPEQLLQFINNLILNDGDPGIFMKMIASQNGSIIFMGEILGNIDPMLWSQFIISSSNYTVGYPSSNLLDNGLIEVMLNIGA